MTSCYVADASCAGGSTYLSNDTLTYRACLSAASAGCSTAIITFTVASAPVQSDSTTAQLDGSEATSETKLVFAGRGIVEAISIASALILVLVGRAAVCRYLRGPETAQAAESRLVLMDMQCTAQLPHGDGPAARWLRLRGCPGRQGLSLTVSPGE